MKNNLRNIAEFLNKTNADVVTLQEADLPSWWSGKFDHVELLAQHENSPYRTTGAHVDAFLVTTAPLCFRATLLFRPQG